MNEKTKVKCGIMKGYCSRRLWLAVCPAYCQANPEKIGVYCEIVRLIFPLMNFPG